MEKNILRVLGNLAYLQKIHGLHGRNGEFVQVLLDTGSYKIERPYDASELARQESIARDMKLIGLETEITKGRMDDGSWQHSGTSYCDSSILVIKLPVSPALEILYGKEKTHNVR